MHSTLEGAHTGIPLSVAREFVNADRPGKLPGHVPHHGLGGPTHLAMGGLGNEEAPYMSFLQRAAARQEVDVPYGFLASGISGRTDRIPASVAADSFVIPAAEVSGLGQGNSLAGSRMWSLALGTGPYGTHLPQASRGPGPPSHHPPSVPGEVMRAITGSRQGGREPHKASVLLAGGEMVVPPEVVNRLGGGDMQKGHKMMREAVKRVRDYNIKRLAELPPPKK